MNEKDLVEHLMRVLPADTAELIYLEASATSWSAAVGLHMEELGSLPDGTPLNSAVTGRRCPAGWRAWVPACKGSSWEELTFLRLTAPGDLTELDLFEELDQRRFNLNAQKVLYRN